jgi:hypothetical protein
VASWFAERPPAQRKIHDAVVKALRREGPFLVEAVGVGILIKRARTFAELRPNRDGLVLGVLLSRVVSHPRITKVLKTSAHRAAHFIPLRDAKDVDREVRAWLVEAYVDSPA